MSITHQLNSRELLSEANFNIAEFRGVEAESASAIFALAEGFLAKGNIFIAAKLMLTASTYDAPDSLYEQGYQECIEPKEKGSVSYEEDDKFDFLCVPSGNTGSSIVSHALAWHPQISALSKAEVDEAINSESMPDFLSRSIPFHQMSQQHRHGIVQHNYIVGNNRLLEKEQWSNKLNQLRDVVKGDTFYHIVRDPLDSVRSRLRRQTMANISQHWREPTGQIKFVKPVKLSRVPKRPMKYNLDSGAGLFDADALKETFYTKESMGYIDQFQIGSEYQKAFPDWQLLDMSDFSKENVSNTLTNLYGKVGVDNTFSLPLLATPQNTNINRIMYSSWIQINHQGHMLTLGLYFADLATFSMDFPFIELAWRDPCEEWLHEGLPNYRLALTSNYQFWANLPLEMRQSLAKSGQLQRVLDNLVYPAILSIAKKTTELSKEIYYYIDDVQLAWVANHAVNEHRPSIDKLIERHPHLAKKWHRYIDFFGGGQP